MAAERERYQPTGMEKFLSIVKSMIMRGLFIYFIMSVFKRPQPTAPPAKDGTVQLPNGMATNLFANGTLFRSLRLLGRNGGV